MSSTGLSSPSEDYLSGDVPDRRTGVESGGGRDHAQAAARRRGGRRRRGRVRRLQAAARRRPAPLRRVRPRVAPARGAGGDRAPPARAGRRRRRLRPRAPAGARRAGGGRRRVVPRRAGGRPRVHRLDHDGARPRLQRHPGRRRRRDHRARLLRHARGAAAAVRRRPADPPLRRSGEGEHRSDRRRRAARRGSARDHLGPLEHRRAAADPGDRRGRRRGHARRGRRRARPGGGRRADRRRPRLRRRHPQVAARPARHRPRVEPRVGSPEADDPDVHPGRPGARVHARRLPQLRAPLGAGRRVRGPSPGRPADRRAGHAPEGGPGRHPQGPPRHADVAGALRRHRLLRGRRREPGRGGRSGCATSTGSPRA